MADVATLDRRGPLAGRRSASVTPRAPCLSFSLRGAVEGIAAVKSAIGVTPAAEACRAVVEGDVAALWLGPDEWLLIAPGEDASSLFTTLETALGAAPHSLVDVSHRNAGFVVSGEGAETLLAEGCPLDLDIAQTPIGFCSRTVLGKCEIVLWRTGTDTFRIECWRSFAPYVAGFLAQAMENL